jgi:hypothetical protein
MRDIVNRALSVDDPSQLADNYDDLVDVLRMLGENKIVLCVGQREVLALDLAREAGENDEDDDVGHRVVDAVMSYQMGISPAWYRKNYGRGPVSPLWTRIGRSLMRMTQQAMANVLRLPVDIDNPEPCITFMLPEVEHKQHRGRQMKRALTAADVRRSLECDYRRGNPHAGACSPVIDSIMTMLFGRDASTLWSDDTVQLSDEEHDAAMTEAYNAGVGDGRIRSVAFPSQSMVDGLYAAVANLDNVVQVVVWENETDAVVAKNGGNLDPHSVYVIVDGGDSAEIANAIWLRKSVGCSMMGAVSETVTDLQGHDHTINFGRPDDVDVYVEIDIETKSGWLAGTAADIVDAIVAASAEPGAVAIGGDSNGVFPWSDIVKWIAGLSGFSIAEVRIGTAPSPATPWQNVPIDFDAIARFEAGNILVTLV